MALSLSLALTQEGEYGFWGQLTIDSQIKGRIGVDLEGEITYHTYSFTTPKDISSISIQLESLDAPLTLAIKQGSSFYSLDDADYVDNRNATTHSYDLTNLMPNSIYNIAVVNESPVVSSYILTLEPAGFQAAQESLVMQRLASQKIGVLTPGLLVNGIITASEDPDLAQYHTYIVDVPEGTKELFVVASSTQDIDLALKYGSDIRSYQSQEEGGDWLKADFTDNDTVTLRVTDPQIGFWYIDVIHSDEGERVYAIEVSLR